MAILRNVNAHRQGQKVRVAEQIRCLAADFPGWGDPNYADYFTTMEPGEEAVVRDVNSHGSNPWTRYTLETEDGRVAIDKVPPAFDWLEA